MRKNIVCLAQNSNTNLEKGLKSLDNSVLRGSFILLLSEKTMDFFDNIAKKAFTEIMSDKTFTLTKNAPILMWVIIIFKVKEKLKESKSEKVKS